MKTDIIDTQDLHEEPVFPTAIKWGLIGSGIGFISTLLFYNLGLFDFSGGFMNSIIVTGFSLILGITIIVLGLKEYKGKVNNGHLTFKNGLLWSLIYGLVAAILGAVLSWVFYTFLAPDFFTEMKEGMVMMFENLGIEGEQLDDQIAELDKSMTLGNQLKNSFIYGIVGSVIIGGISSLVMKTK